jgi:hypothetical protein
MWYGENRRKEIKIIFMDLGNGEHVKTGDKYTCAR